MGFIVIIPFAALSGWSIFAITRWLIRGKYDRQWWRAFAILSAVGLALGIWFAFFIHYEVVKRARIKGFPIPVEFANREKPEDEWVPSAMPVAVQLGGTITNLISGIALCLAPIAVAAFLKE